MRDHLPAPDHRFMDTAPALYAIRIYGHLGSMMLSAFPAMTSQRDGTDTVLRGLLDRSALYGVLAEIDALGLDLLEIHQLGHPSRVIMRGSESGGEGWPAAGSVSSP
jgi:hypothetical protein